jgi:preprotein translocase subunit SecA
MSAPTCLARRVLSMSDEMARQSDAELLAGAHRVRWMLQSGAAAVDVLPTAFALVVESAWRTCGQRCFPVQILGGITMLQSGVAEMQTGEGKTLTALLPVFLRGLYGVGCHVLTANDYLAQRDAQYAKPILQRLGLSVGWVESESDPHERRAAYDCDVTYGTGKEMSFDFLRDRLSHSTSADFDPHVQDREHPAASSPVQRGHFFALIDEADSILIDQARTPMVIAISRPHDARMRALFHWGSQIAARLREESDYRFHRQKRAASLTRKGRCSVLLASKPPSLNSFDSDNIIKQTERALTARCGFTVDRDYVVVGGRVQIVDESTGRILDGRKWQDGLHQAIEIKEGVELSSATAEAARVTLQGYLTRYHHLAGMTGTAASVSRELKRVYGLKVVRVPPNRPCLRSGLKPRVFLCMDHKLAAIAGEIRRLQAESRAVLVGTPSVEASEALVQYLDAQHIAYQLLHARHDASEAAIIDQAGQPRRVTIATNMAGRGTDVRVTDSVKARGGLHIIATEMHSSGRIDRQLIGRTARQGEPGSFQFLLSLDDELLRSLVPHALLQARRNARPNREGQISRRFLSLFRTAQKRLERSHERQRRDLLKQEREHQRTCRDLGLNPHLDFFESSCRAS